MFVKLIAKEKELPIDSSRYVIIFMFNLKKNSLKCRFNYVLYPGAGLKNIIDGDILMHKKNSRNTIVDSNYWWKSTGIPVKYDEFLNLLVSENIYYRSSEL